MPFSPVTFSGSQRTLAFATIGIAALLCLSGPQAHAQQTGRAANPGNGQVGGGKVAAPVDASVAALAREMNVTTDCAHQVLALDADKDSRTPAQKKIESSLIYAARMAAGLECAPGVPTLDTGVTPNAAGMVAVLVDTVAPESAAREIFLQGGSVTTESGTTLPVAMPRAQKVVPIGGVTTSPVTTTLTTLLAWMPLRQIETLAGYGDVVGIHLYMPPQTVGQAAARGASRPFSGALVPLLPKKRDAAAKRRAMRTLLSGLRGASGPLTDGLPDALRDTLTLSALGATDYNGADTGVIDEGVTTHDVYATYTNYGVSGYNAALGRPLRIGVLSTDDTFLSNSLGSNDLPPLDTSTYGTGTTASTTVAIDDTQNPPVSQDGTGSFSTGEGTAMMEIVHDMLPDAKIFFAAGFPTQQQFAKNIMLLRFKYHCDIICDDIYYYAEAPFSDDTISQAVNQVTADGCLYFVSAGNFGHITHNSYPQSSNNYGTSGTWEGDFADGGPVTQIGATAVVGNLHAFNSGQTAPFNHPYGQTFNQAENAGGSYTFLNWSDPATGSSNDYDLYSTNSAGTTVTGTGNSTQTGSASSYPYEYVSRPAAGSRLYVLKKNSAAVRAIHLNTFGSYYFNYPSLDFSTNGGTYGHAGTLNGFGIAATPATNLKDPYGSGPFGGPYPGIFSASNVSEYFSSDGPRTMFYDTSGGPNVPVAVTPPYTFPHSAPTFSAVGSAPTFAVGGKVRAQPALTAADGVSVSAAFNGGSLQPFFGTSAASPHAAAICGLVMSYSASGVGSGVGYSGLPGLTLNGGLLSVGEMHTVLQSATIDIEAAGFDNTTGYGILMPARAISFLRAFLYNGVIFATPSSTTAAINWNTLLPANATIQYGLTPSLGSTYTDNTLTTSHQSTLTGLTAGKTYYYKVTTATASGAAVYSDPTPRTFTTTAATPPSIALNSASASSVGGLTLVQVQLANRGGAASDVVIAAASLNNASATTIVPSDLGPVASGGTASSTLTFPQQPSGTRVLRLTVTDGTGAIFNISARITVP